MVIPLPESPSPDQIARRERLAAWLQFPRRLVLLLLGWALSRVVLSAVTLATYATRRDLPQQWDWSQSLVSQSPVAEIVTHALPNTLLLVGAVLVLALGIAVLLALVAVCGHWLARRTSFWGALLGKLGRLLASLLAAPPAWLLCLLLVLLLYRLHAFSFYGPADKTLSGQLRHLAAPLVALAALPGVITARAISREVVLSGVQSGPRRWLTGVFRGLGTLLGQIGGLLSAAMLVEVVFGWPGLGWVALERGLWQLDFPVFLAALSVGTVIILGGRIAAEFFRWLERLVRGGVFPKTPSPGRGKVGKIYLLVALALLLIPLGLAAAGLTIDADAAARQNLRDWGAPPSPEHPWGTDSLGRDLQARVLRGGLVTLGVAALAAVSVVLLAGPTGALAGFLAERKTLLGESLADLLLWPAGVLLFIPVVPAAVLLAFLFLPSVAFHGAHWLQAVLPVAIVLLPRTMRAAQGLWPSRPVQKRGWALAAGLGALFLGTALAALSPIALNNFFGLGVRAPAPELGLLVLEGGIALRSYPLQLLAPGLALWACAVALYVAADALSDDFSPEVLAHLNS